MLKLFKCKNPNGFALPSTGTFISGNGVLIDVDSPVGKEALRYANSSLEVSEDDGLEHPMLRQVLDAFVDNRYDLLGGQPKLVLRPATKKPVAQVKPAAPAKPPVQTIPEPQEIKAPEPAQPTQEVAQPEAAPVESTAAPKVKFGGKGK